MYTEQKECKASARYPSGRDEVQQYDTNDVYKTLLQLKAEWPNKAARLH